MTEAEFQRLVLQELRGIKTQINGTNEEISGIKGEISGIKGEVSGIKGEINSIKTQMNYMNNEIIAIKVRQDEMYEIVKAIEHSNQVGKAEIENNNLRLTKIEGKIKKVAQAYNEEDNDKAANL